MSETPPCPHCPVRRLACPGLTEPRYCRLAEREPARYRPVILWRARGRAGLAERLPPPRAFDGTVPAAVLVDDTGGAAAGRWLADLLRHADPGRVTWTGLALGAGGPPDPDLGRALEGLIPVHGGPPDAGGGGPDDRVLRHGSAHQALRAACHGAEVLVAVDVPDLGPRAAGLGLPVVLAVTGPTAGGPGGLADAARRADRLVAASAAAAAAFAADRTADVAVIPPGVPAERSVPRLGRGRQRAAWGLDGRHVVVGLDARHWPGSALRAAARAVTALGGDHRLVAVGEPPPAPSIEPVTWAPPRTHLGDVLAAADVFLAAPRPGHGGDPPGLVEAWLAGVPAVALTDGADDNNGPEPGPLAVPAPRDPAPDDLVAAIRRALGEGHRPAVARARGLAWGQRTVAAMAERWTHVLTEAARPGTA